MKPVSRILASVSALYLMQGALLLCTQNDPGKGWIEGVILAENGHPACSVLVMGNCGGAGITVRPKEGNGNYTQADPNKGGFYSFHNLKPGIYEVFVDKTVHGDRGQVIDDRPQHVFGLVVRADVRTVLNFTVHEGQGLEEVGKPVVISEKAIILADELARLSKEIEELKKK
jgi:hypothetical protein